MKSLSNRFIITTIVMTIVLGACRDVIEPDISNMKLDIISPIDSLVTNISTQTFWWNPLDGAEYYHIQIVSPNFLNSVQFIADTLCTGNTFQISFNPGHYQWRIKAVNNGSETAFITRNIFMDSSATITNQSVALTSPPDNFFTNQTSVVFKWNDLYSADNYRFRILDATNNIIRDTTIYGIQISQSLSEGTFQWQVSAENSTGSTPFSTRTISIDLTPPPAPSTLIPTDQDTLVSTLVQMSWNSDLNSIGDSLYIYDNVSQTNLIYSGLITTGSYSFSGTTSHTYYWKLNSIDSAGNISSTTSLYRFYIL